MMYWWWGDHLTWWGWAVMLVGNLAFLALVAAGIVGLWRFGRPRGDGARSTPRQLLADRFARGEIDEAQYRRHLDVLSETAGHQPTSPP